MQNDDHTSIKYLMKELDPAEAVLFEQRMMEDEELLLEVECMRRTLRRLEKLPMKNPPSELTEYIVRKACSRNCSSHFKNWWKQYSEKSLTKYYAAAAMILIGMGIGLMSFQNSVSEKAANQTGQAVSKADISAGEELTSSEEVSSYINDNVVIILNRSSEHNSNTDYFKDSVHFEQDDPQQAPNQGRSDFLNSGSVQLTGSSR